MNSILVCTKAKVGVWRWILLSLVLRLGIRNNMDISISSIGHKIHEILKGLAVSANDSYVRSRWETSCTMISRHH